MCSTQTLSRLLSTEIPLILFINLYYNGGISIADESELEGTFVKLIVEDKGDYSKFDYNIKRLQDMSLADLKIVEDLSVALENGSEVVETEDTMTLLDKYIDEIDTKVDKSNIKSVMRSLYMLKHQNYNVYNHRRKDRWCLCHQK